MIQKNRIMTKKGIIIFDRNIDVEKTQENGKKVCEAYAPLIQQRIRLNHLSILLHNYMGVFGLYKKLQSKTPIRLHK